ncbi:flagellar basal body-associated FliL family protein [Brevibacillus ginsengisoli]|uniref:flagellar basal body-associated FliL family protein n=1 Tax=Brevibacillus ginsengisoli TaxID=363854 RepID=UPI003CF73C68
MFQNKLFNMALITIIAITLLGVASFVLYQTYLSPTSGEHVAKEQPALSADDMVSFTMDTGDITTNLLTNNYIIVRFSITADSKAAKEELTKRTPQVNQIIIKTLAGLTPDDIKGTEGLNKLEAKVMNQISSVLQEGKIVQVITTKRVLQ